MPADTVIEVTNLQKRYGSTVAVDDVSFEIQRNEIFGLLGPSGAGKTTTIECLQALRSPDSGRIRVLGLDRPRHTSHSPFFSAPEELVAHLTSLELSGRS